MPFDDRSYDAWGDKPYPVNRRWLGVTIKDVLSELRTTLVLIILGVAVYYSPAFVHTVIHTMLYIWATLFILLIIWVIVCCVPSNKE